MLYQNLRGTEGKHENKGRIRNIPAEVYVRYLCILDSNVTAKLVLSVA
jgi:hypothetical protein